MKYPNTVSAEETKYTPLTDATGKRYEAEDAELSGSGVETEHNGFSGEGYVGKMYNGSAKIGFQQLKRLARIPCNYAMQMDTERM